jgi:hypothetical protein
MLDIALNSWRFPVGMPLKAHGGDSSGGPDRVRREQNVTSFLVYALRVGLAAI